jgi:hypothetical protein
LPTTTSSIRRLRRTCTESFRRLAYLFSEVAKVLKEEVCVLLKEEEEEEEDKEEEE